MAVHFGFWEVALFVTVAAILAAPIYSVAKELKRMRYPIDSVAEELKRMNDRLEERDNERATAREDDVD